MSSILIPYLPEIIMFVVGFIVGGTVVERALRKKENKNPDN